jgi:hypothetical protein
MKRLDTNLDTVYYRFLDRLRRMKERPVYVTKKKSQLGFRVFLWGIGICFGLIVSLHLWAYAKTPKMEMLPEPIPRAEAQAEGDF